MAKASMNCGPCRTLMSVTHWPRFRAWPRLPASADSSAEYHVDVDPAKLRAFNVPIPAIFLAVAASNVNVGGKVILSGSSEYILRGVGWLDGGTAAVGSLRTSRSSPAMACRCA